MPTNLRITKSDIPAGLLGAIFESLTDDDHAEDCRECLKAKHRLDVLACATPTQFGQIWDRTLRGEKFEALVDELGKIQAEWDAAETAKKERST